jgi:hypothetical protein
MILILRAASLAVTIAVSSIAAASPPPQLEQALEAAYSRHPPRSFSYALFDLNEDGVPDALVLITDPIYCGTGGCTLVVFQGMPDGSFRRISATTSTREPIRILKERSHGWHAFSAWVSGAAAHPCIRVMPFGGSGYPSSPTGLPCATPGAVHWSIHVTLIPNS